jgi:hypothetical protein
LRGVPAEGGEGGEAPEEADDYGLAKSCDQELTGRRLAYGSIGREPHELPYHSDEQTADDVDQAWREEVLAGR